MRLAWGSLRQVDEFRIGDRLVFRGRTFVVRGFSPMSLVPRRLQLEDVETHEWLEASVDDVRADISSVPGKGQEEHPAE